MLRTRNTREIREEADHLALQTITQIHNMNTQIDQITDEIEADKERRSEDIFTQRKNNLETSLKNVASQCEKMIEELK
jgi:hypothetical protein